MSSPSRRFFDQYSVFCVFGSVLGCVVVPIVSQIIKTQSMECVILSAIVLSFTAAHLKTSKRSTDGQNTKIIIKDSEKRRVVHAVRKKNNLAKEHQQRHDDELEYIQQFEHLKVQELERKQEDKKLKKSKKREEKLRLRNEDAENISAQPSCSVKTRKQKKEEEKALNSINKVTQASIPLHPHTKTTTQDQLNDPLHNNIEQKCTPERRQSITTATATTNIPRFVRRQRFLSDPKPTPPPQVTPQKAKPQQQRRASGMTMTAPLTIKCNANLSGSCSSLSSLSSSSSSDASISPFLHTPPSSAAALNATTASPWKLPVQNLSTTPLWMPGQDPPPRPQPQAASTDLSTTLRYSQVEDCRPASAFCYTKSTKAGSSSLFCQSGSCHDPVAVLLDACGQSGGGIYGSSATAGGDEPEVCGAEYSLFGPPRFSCALGRATAN